jgi:hypothetical protein
MGDAVETTWNDGHRFRVNALAPGPISGNWEQEWGVAPEHIDEAKAMSPLKRFGDPREIAETVLFLASDGAGYVNGQVIRGGWLGPSRMRLELRPHAGGMSCHPALTSAGGPRAPGPLVPRPPHAPGTPPSHSRR